MNSDDTNQPPSCFGDLDTVFPMRSDGFRVTPVECLQCRHKTKCLRSAMGSASGYTVREEMIERAHRRGLMGFFQRWSQKKTVHRLKKEKSQR